ncbi:MAG: Spy/CpxP family protein refolding chaperone [Pseudomonadota bacterium]|nr:Spy/CpxP family protein refolding chaperone [Pseudomonadota bacterium]
MKFALKPLHSIVLAGLLASVGAGAVLAQAPAAPATPASAAEGKHWGHHGAHHGGQHKMGRHDPAKMQAWMAQRQAELKAKLKITASQESAWTAYTAAMQPPARIGQRPTPEQRAELDKLSTPERIDKMQALRKQRMSEMSAAMDRRDEATKAFYAALTPEQQKTFDARRTPHGSHEGRHQHGGTNPKN